MILLNPYKIVLPCLSLTLLFFLHSSVRKSPGVTESYSKHLRVDTIQGYFLYEANVPFKCYSRYDQIEQSHNLIFFDSSISTTEIISSYQKGVFAYQFQPMIDKIITQKQISIPQNKNNFWKFHKAISYIDHVNDSVYNNQLYYDRKNILAYKKVYATFATIDLGKIGQLVPNTDNYSCCYSNTTDSLNTYFITDVIDFIIY